MYKSKAWSGVVQLQVFHKYTVVTPNTEQWTVAIIVSIGEPTGSQQKEIGNRLQESKQQNNSNAQKNAVFVKGTGQ